MTAPPTYAPMNASDLLPCPFCGGVAQFVASEVADYVTCPNQECDIACEAIGHNKSDAIRAWNTRASARAPSGVDRREEVANYSDGGLRGQPFDPADAAGVKSGTVTEYGQTGRPNREENGAEQTPGSSMSSGLARPIAAEQAPGPSEAIKRARGNPAQFAVADYLFNELSKLDGPPLYTACLALSQGLIALLNAPQWGPIETAPKDGDRILLGWHGQMSAEGFWHDGLQNYWKLPGFYFADDDLLTGKPSDPDCWTPLPVPPDKSAAWSSYQDKGGAA